MSSLVGSRGRITIDKDLRDRLGLKPGWRVFQRIEADTIVLEFHPPRHQRSPAGILPGKTRTLATDEELYAAIEESWEVVAHEIEMVETVG